MLDFKIDTLLRNYVIISPQFLKRFFYLVFEILKVSGVVEGLPESGVTAF